MKREQFAERKPTELPRRRMLRVGYSDGVGRGLIKVAEFLYTTFMASRLL